MYVGCICHNDILHTCPRVDCNYIRIDIHFVETEQYSNKNAFKVTMVTRLHFIGDSLKTFISSQANLNGNKSLLYYRYVYNTVVNTTLYHCYYRSIDMVYIISSRHSYGIIFICPCSDWQTPNNICRDFVQVTATYLGPLLMTWINFNPSMLAPLKLRNR